jgi:ribonuclease HI
MSTKSKTGWMDDVTKSSDPLDLMRASQRTIDAYPDDWIHVYTNKSAVKATIKSGYGIYIEYPDRTSDELVDPCGEIGSNYQAEITALEFALYRLKSIIDMSPSKAQNIVIFTDSMSTLQALEDGGHCKTECAHIIQDTNHFITSHRIRIAM